LDDEFAPKPEWFNFVLELLLTDEAALETNCLPIIPLPDDHTVLTSQSELKVTKEMSEWEHEELVT